MSQSPNKKQTGLLHVLARQKGLIDGNDKTAYQEWLASRYNGVISSSHLSPQELSDAVDALRGKPQGARKWPGVRAADAYEKGDDSCEARAG